MSTPTATSASRRWYHMDAGIVQLAVQTGYEVIGATAGLGLNLTVAAVGQQ